MSLIHRITHKAITFSKHDVGSVFMCYRRLFPRFTFVELTAPDGTVCGERMSSENFEKFTNEMVSEKKWTTDLIHELIHKYAKRSNDN